jgi:TDG/mug DNA glycosylase family protein
MVAALVRSFAPISTPRARILILGSMPGTASLEAGQYYAHPRNAFWRIMEDLTGVRHDAPYEERVRSLNQRRIAVWDVLECCLRPGSLDSRITEERPNDFQAFFTAHRHITHIGLNGGKAAGSFRQYAARHCPAHIVVTQLPSTSPAHAGRSYEQKTLAWQKALGSAIAKSR